MYNMHVLYLSVAQFGEGVDDNSKDEVESDRGDDDEERHLVDAQQDKVDECVSLCVLGASKPLHMRQHQKICCFGKVRWFTNIAPHLRICCLQRRCRHRRGRRL